MKRPSPCRQTSANRVLRGMSAASGRPSRCGSVGSRRSHLPESESSTGSPALVGTANPGSVQERQAGTGSWSSGPHALPCDHSSHDLTHRAETSVEIRASEIPTALASRSVVPDRLDAHKDSAGSGDRSWKAHSRDAHTTGLQTGQTGASNSDTASG